jgi:hypothetical protein
MADVLQEFLVSVKYAVDAASQRNFLDMVKRVTTSVGGLTAIAGAAATGFVAMAHAMAETGEKLYFMSMRMNEAAGNIQAATYAMTQFGMSTGEAVAQLEAFGSFERSKGPAATAWLQFLGVTATTTRERLEQLGPALAAMGGTAGQQGTLGYSLALRAAAKMGLNETAMLDLASGEWARRAAEYDRILAKAGVSMDAYAKHSHDLMVSFRQLGMIFDVLWTAFADRLLTGLNVDLKQLFDMFQADLPSIVKWVRFFADALVFLAHSVTSIIIGINDLFGLINHLPNSLKLVAAAFAVFNTFLVRSPIFWFIAGITALLLLLDDFQTFMRGGESTIDWSWAKGIHRFMQETLGLKGGFGDLILIAIALLTFFNPLVRVFSLVARGLGLLPGAAPAAAGALTTVGRAAGWALRAVGGLRLGLGYLLAAMAAFELGKEAHNFASWVAKQIWGENADGGPEHKPYTVGDALSGKPAPVDVATGGPGGAPVGATLGGAVGAGVLGGSAAVHLPAAPAPAPAPAARASPVGNAIRTGLGISPAAAAEPMEPGDQSAPRNIRNFNPGNVSFIGQEGAVPEPGSGRFARFPNMVAGVAAMVNQIRIDYFKHNQRTLTDLIAGAINPATGQREHGWAPAFENNTPGYIASLARQIGIDPDAPFDPNDPALLARLGTAITQVEAGKKNMISPEVMAAGVQRALGGRPLLPAGAAGGGGGGGATQAGDTNINHTVNVTVPAGPTAGATANAVASAVKRENENLVRDSRGSLR